MQLESLKMFCDVVETGSFSRAAQLNHVTQSAVSQQIRALENRYEQKLLSRSARLVSPTPSGERLFRGCKEILARFGEVEQGDSKSRTWRNRRHHDQSPPSIPWGFHELRNDSKAAPQGLHPQGEPARLQLPSQLDQVYDDVILGSGGDLALSPTHSRVQAWDVLDFREDKLAIVCAPSHPFASKSKVSLTALSHCLHPSPSIEKAPRARRWIRFSVSAGSKLSR